MSGSGEKLDGISPLEIDTERLESIANQGSHFKLDGFVSILVGENCYVGLRRDIEV